MSPGLLALLVGLAVVAGLDLASLLQGLLSRPLVVGAGSGLLLGDVETGLRVGAVLELFALDVVPVGASRYPDFGAATVAGVVYAAGGAWVETLGAAVGLGLVLAIAGGTTLPLTRRWNARALERRAEALAAGDPAAVRRVHLAGLGHDALRSLVLGLVGVGLGLAFRAGALRPDPELGWWLTLAALGGGVWAAAHGATVAARAGGRSRWALAGLGLGLIGVLA